MVLWLILILSNFDNSINKIIKIFGRITEQTSSQTLGPDFLSHGMKTMGQ